MAKPPGPLTPDTSHPLMLNCEVLGLFSEYTGNPMFWTPGDVYVEGALIAGASWVQDKGVSCNPNKERTQWVTVPIGLKESWLIGGTIFMVEETTRDDQDNFNHLYGTETPHISMYAMCFDRGTAIDIHSARQGVYVIQTLGDHILVHTSTGLPDTGERGLWADGSEVIPEAAVDLSAWTTDDPPFYMMGSRQGGRGFSGIIQMFGISYRKWTDQEIASFSADPWQIVQGAGPTVPPNRMAYGANF